MSNYIDADLLKKEIDRLEEEARKVRVSGTDKEAIGADGKVSLCLKLKSVIDSLQQEKSTKLSIDDIKQIVNIHRDVLAEHPDRIMGSEKNYEDTLKRFLEYKSAKK